MHDVNVSARLAAERDHHRDGLDFRCRRSRVEPRLVSRRTRASCGSCQRGGCFGMHEKGNAARRKDRHHPSQIALIDGLELFDTRRGKETLEPADAGVTERLHIACVAGNDAAPESHVDQHAPARRRALRLQSLTLVVAGTLFSGMSTIVVIPPAAAAAVAVANPSHSVRPGSLTCTCVSTSPGMITKSPASRRTANPCSRSSYAPTRRMRPSRHWIVAGDTPSGRTTRVDRITNSVMPLYSRG